MIDSMVLSTAIGIISNHVYDWISNQEEFDPKLLKDLNETVDRQLNKEKILQKDKLADLISSFKEEKLVMVLGAGVSVGHGTPDWNTLLQKLLLNAFVSEQEQTQDKSTVLAKLFTEVFSPSPLISARYLLKHYQDNGVNKKESFEEIVRKAIYENVDFNKESELFNEIRQLCVAPGKSPNLDSIITYNYDDILETCLKGVGVDIPFKSIYSVGMNPSRGELPIYHVHGFLPHEGNLSEINNITLSEDGYHKQYTDIYSWNNIIQINKFTDFTCLFIGISFTDPNLRRLMDIARLQRGNDEKFHYLIKRKYNVNSLKTSIEKILAINEHILDEKKKADLKLDETVERLVSVMEKFEENDALSFGVRTIWINEYAEIPKILHHIRMMNPNIA